jgi:hypothetical protein
LRICSCVRPKDTTGTLTARTLWVSKPGVADCSATSVRNSIPAPARSTNDAAICMTANMCNRRFVAPVIRRPPLRYNFDAETRTRRVRLGMFFDDRGMRGAELGPRRIHVCTRREPAENFGHAMFASFHHCGGKMVGTRNHVGDQFCFGGIWIGWFQYTNNRCGARTETNCCAKNRWIAMEACTPKTMGQYCCARRGRAIVCGIQETSQRRTKSHHFEVVAGNNSGAYLPRVPEPDHRECDC